MVTNLKQINGFCLCRVVRAPTHSAYGGWRCAAGYADGRFRRPGGGRGGVTFALGCPASLSVHRALPGGTEFCMKIFLTGGSGYIGSATALRLKKAGHDVLALVRSEEKGRHLKEAGLKPAGGGPAHPPGDAAPPCGRAPAPHPPPHPPAPTPPPGPQ